ncbi:MFS transporter [Rodentibacter mrazii]|uniref:MFS transporter n=1 Tax=Rodentibacter mrazii TaxID=1908257 RepID=A0A1V3ICL9_9PAST|nr:MFS transporter [Rodentibacter mrazii]OOF38090.1 MFS transporter [Rodentibacter mrazii]
MQKMLTIRLMTMMLLQYFVQGSWSMMIGAVLSGYGMRNSIGTTYTLLGLATIISPLFIGMIADRFFAAEKVLGTLHLLNSLVLYQVALAISHQYHTVFFVLIFTVGLLYYPTLALSNSIAFRHLEDSRLFPFIRVVGNIGFILSGLAMGYYEIFNHVVVFKVATFASIIYGIYCFSLPNTPPITTSLNWRTLFCLDAFQLFKDRYFSLFMMITLLVMISKTAYSAYMPVYLKDFHLNAANMMQIGVVSEVLMMLFLSLMIKRWGFKPIMLIGIIAWAVRSLLLAMSAISTEPLLYILTSLVLQGICWTFFFTVGDMYVNSKAQNHIRTQAQSLRHIFSNGLGILISSSLIGLIYNHTLTHDKLPEIATQWATFWWYPTLIASVSAVIFLLFFKERC